MSAPREVIDLPAEKISAESFPRFRVFAYPKVPGRWDVAELQQGADEDNLQL